MRRLRWRKNRRRDEVGRELATEAVGTVAESLMESAARSVVGIVKAILHALT
ncbi:hypothetical protein [Nocardia yunnanensis]|uniref:hypothetical protein n=1 Tax=Nocardia yunnanensis TaxID=2382165 RepID=UPI0013C4BFC7|nr:hypothetical protein [Nocardia yunnanensis]